MATNDSNTGGENDLQTDDGLRDERAGVGGTTTASETFDRVGTAASEFNDAGRMNARGVDEDAASDDSPLRWLIPLLLLGLLIILGYTFCGKSEPTATTTTAPAVNANANKTLAVVVPANSNSAAKKVDSSFTLRADNGKYTVSGIVPDEAARKQIVDALTAQYGAGNVNFDGLKVDAGARPFASGWWNNFAKILPDLKDWKTGELSFAGSALTTASGLPATAIAQIKSLFAGYRLPVSIAGEAGALKEANDEALKNLGEAKSVSQVVDALNLSIINFASGSSAIPADAEPILKRAAEVLKAQTIDSSVEVSGHTDNKGDAAGNQKLSQARAEAVRSELIKLGVGEKMLTAKGYGDTKPVATNDTEDGRFQNRRIGYAVINGVSGTTETTTTNANK